MYKIEHYKTGAGKDLIKDYIDEASRKYGIREVALIRAAVMLLRNHGFRKKTQKTPRHEIDTARAQMDEYIRRNK